MLPCTSSWARDHGSAINRDYIHFVYTCICSGTLWEYTILLKYTPTGGGGAFQQMSGHVIDLNVSFKEAKSLVCSFLVMLIFEMSSAMVTPRHFAAETS